MPITTTSIIAANVAVMLGAILQASTGLGAGLIIVPLLALVSLAFVPGVLVLIAVAVSASMPRLERTIPVTAGAGVLSGFMGAISGIGAPILALIYQHERPLKLRATLGFIFFLSSIAILVCLHFAGRFGWEETWLGLWLVPGYVVGFLVAPPIARALDRNNSRFAVLLISTLSAIVLIVRSL
jgi:uncharacterized membrane protein YfcA